MIDARSILILSIGWGKWILPTRHTHHAASWVFLRKINIISALPILQAELPTILDHIYLKSLLVATK